MTQAVFLVSTLEGARKPNFSKQLLNALNQGFDVQVVLGMVDFKEDWPVRALFNELAQKTPAIRQVTLLSLADLYQDVAGIQLAPEERHAPELTGLTVKTFATSEQFQLKRYLRDGKIVAERQQLNDATPTLITQYADDRVIQEDTYDVDGRLMGIQRYSDDRPTTSYVFNTTGQVVLRFVRHERPIREVFNLDPQTSVAPQTFTELTYRAAGSTENQTTVMETTEVSDEVLEYGNYHRFTTLSEFYRYTFRQFFSPDSRLFIDLAINAQLSPQLPDQLIFNY